MTNLRARKAAQDSRPACFRPENTVDDDDDEEECNPLVDVNGKSRRSSSSTTSTLSLVCRSIAAASLILLWLPLHHFIKPGLVSVPSWWVSSRSPSRLPTVQELRRMAASASVDLLLQTSDDPKLDVGALCDIVDASIDAVGVRGLLLEVFETHAFRREVVSVSQTRKVLPGLSTTFEEHHMNVFYDGLINEPLTGGNHAQCTGCLWWLRHYVGAAIADRLLRDGSLSLDGQRGEDQRISDAKSFMKELHDLQRLPDSDFVTISTEHSFVWHTLAATRPGLPNGYPTDLLKEWCGIYVVAGIWQTKFDTDLGRECRHAFGHAIFYAVVRGSEGKTAREHYSARTQIRPHSYDLPKELGEKMFAICRDAPINDLSRHECYGGTWHSWALLQKTKPPVLDMGGPELKGPGDDFVSIEMFKAKQNVNEAPGEDRPLRVAMMGSGIWARMAHMPILSNNPNFDTKAIWSRRIEGASSLATEFKNCTAYGGEEGLETLLSRDDIDAIIMSLPLDKQPFYVMKVLDAGKHVLSEKPTAGTTKEGWEAIKTYREKYQSKGLVWAVAEDSRYNAMYGEMAKAVRETMGPLKQLDFSIKMNMDPGSPWLKTEWRAKSSWGDLGFFIDGVVHHVSGLRLIATGPPVAVQANLTSNLDYMPGYDTLRAYVEYGDGASGIFEASYTNDKGHGDLIRASDSSNGTVTAIPGRGVSYSGSESKRVKGGGKEQVFISFANECKRAAATNKHDEFNEDDNITPEQSLLDVAFLEACLESSLAGGERREIQASM